MPNDGKKDDKKKKEYSKVGRTKTIQDNKDQKRTNNSDGQ
jgi:hypothetical protein